MPTYNPQSNSVERAHRNLNTMLRVLCHQHAADWEEVLPAVLLALRSAVHESTGVTQFACLYGREPATPVGLGEQDPGRSINCPTRTTNDSKITSSARTLLCRFSSPELYNVPAGGTAMRRTPSSREKKYGCSHRGPLLIGNWRFRIQGHGGLPNNSPARSVPFGLRVTGASSRRTLPSC